MTIVQFDLCKKIESQRDGNIDKEFADNISSVVTVLKCICIGESGLF